MDLAALRRWWPFAIVAALLGLAALAAGHSSLEPGIVGELVRASDMLAEKLG